MARAQVSSVDIRHVINRMRLEAYTIMYSSKPDLDQVRASCLLDYANMLEAIISG